MAIFMEKSLWLWRRKHEVMLESNTVLAQGRVVHVARRREYRVCGGRSDGLPVGICVVQSLQNLVEFRGIVVWRVFWLAWLRRMFHALISPVKGDARPYAYPLLRRARAGLSGMLDAEMLSDLRLALDWVGIFG